MVVVDVVESATEAGVVASLMVGASAVVVASSVVVSVKRRLDDSARVSSSEGEGLRFNVDDMVAVVCGC